MKTNKILKVMCTMIIIILLVMVSFIGIYVSKNGKMENIVKDFTLGLEVGGGRQVILSPINDIETVYEREDGVQLINGDNIAEEDLANYTEKQVSINPKEVLTAENFKKAKEIFEQRLDISGLSEYHISLNEETGNITLQALEDNVLDNVIYTIFASGEFILQDSETLEILLDNSDIKNAQVGYRAMETGTGIYLTIQLDKEGTKKLEEISSKYVATTDEEGNDTTKTVTLYIDGTTITSTYFGETITNGVLQLSIGAASDNTEELTQYIMEATNLATVLSTGLVEVEYEMTHNEFIGTAVLSNLVTLTILITIGIITAMAIYLIVKYKDRGIIGAIAYAGYVAALLLIIRLTNVVITIESLGALTLAFIFNYVFTNVLLEKIVKHKENESTPKAEINRIFLKALLISVPALIVALVFCFISFMSISSFGTCLFWGITLFMVYNYIITKPLLLNFEYLFEE